MKRSPKIPKGKRRSPKWRAVRAKFLKGKHCAVCGGSKKLEAHHKMPFHLDPSLELDPTNLIALCEGARQINCHLFVGHLGSFQSYNPSVHADAVQWRIKVAERP